jgi:hypothetical protein
MKISWNWILALEGEGPIQMKEALKKQGIERGRFWGGRRNRDEMRRIWQRMRIYLSWILALEGEGPLQMNEALKKQGIERGRSWEG